MTLAPPGQPGQVRITNDDLPGEEAYAALDAYRGYFYALGWRSVDDPLYDGSESTLPVYPQLVVDLQVAGFDQSRWFGRKTTSGAPSTGTWEVGDWISDSAGAVWVCTVAGTPGTWVNPTGGGGGTVSDTAYAGSWDGVTTVAPSKNAVYDQMELRAPKASPTFSGTIALSTVGAGDGATLSYRLLNTVDDNVRLILGTGQAVTNAAAQTYAATIQPRDVNTSGALSQHIGLNIGQYVVTATDGASAVTRTGEFAAIEGDFIQFQQTGGTAIFNRAVHTRFRFAVPKTGVTIVDSKGIDFVVPNSGDVTGAVTNYIAINIPALTGGGGTNFYGIKFNNEPSGGSIVSVNNDLSVKALTNGTDVKVVASSGGHVRFGSAAAGAIGSLQFTAAPGSPVSHRIAFGTDGTGYQLAWAKNVAGTITNLMTLQDNGAVVLTAGITLTTVTATGSVASGGTVSGSFAVTSGGNITTSSGGSIRVGTTDTGSGANVIGLKNATTLPSANPSGGGVLYAEGGALKWRGSSGTITTLAVA